MRACIGVSSEVAPNHIEQLERLADVRNQQGQMQQSAANQRQCRLGPDEALRQLGPGLRRDTGFGGS